LKRVRNQSSTTLVPRKKSYCWNEIDYLRLFWSDSRISLSK